jgi:hypothetical protein
MCVSMPTLGTKRDYRIGTVVPTPGAAPSLAGARQVLAGYLRAFPDLHLTIDTLLA